MHYIFILLLAVSAITAKTTIYSTEQGGNWDEPNTWVGGKVPTVNDEVVIKGNITLLKENPCKKITISKDGVLIINDDKTAVVKFNTCYSTKEGGNWNDPSTWVGGKVPTVNDNVVLTSVVKLDPKEESNFKSLKSDLNGVLEFINVEDPLDVCAHAWLNADKEIKISSISISYKNEETSKFAFSEQNRNRIVSHSTLKGGDWNDPNTWFDGKVPSIDSEIYILGDVTVKSHVVCKNLNILRGGKLNVIPVLDKIKGVMYDFEIMGDMKIEKEGKLIINENAYFLITQTAYVQGDGFNFGTLSIGAKPIIQTK